MPKFVFKEKKTSKNKFRSSYSRAKKEFGGWEESRGEGGKRNLPLDVIKCKIITTKRDDKQVEKHLTSEWYQFVRQKKLKVGDKLIFQLSDPTKFMHVEIVRRITGR
jgi:hypothetical protein